MSSAGSPSVVLCAAKYFDWQKHMCEYHVATSLSAHIPVLYVDPPTSPLTRLKNPELAHVLDRPRLRPVRPGLHHLTPAAPPKPHAPTVAWLTARMVRRAIRSAVAELGHNPIALITNWSLIDVFDACPGAQRVYWLTDDPKAASALWGYDERQLAAADRRARSRADLVLAVSELLVAEEAAAGHRARFLPNGCDVATMARVDLDPVAPEVTLPRPIAGFIGQLNSRTDLALLESVADTGLSLLIVGPAAADFEPDRFGRLCRRPNVAWVGPQPFDRMPAFHGLMDVGLVPYADNQFNRSSFPLKVLEHLAAGRPVVSTDLPAVRWIDSPDVVLAADPVAFARAALVAANHPLAASDVARRRAFAAEHSWASRALDLLDALGAGEEAR